MLYITSTSIDHICNNYLGRHWTIQVLSLQYHDVHVQCVIYVIEFIIVYYIV